MVGSYTKICDHLTKERTLKERREKYLKPNMSGRSNKGTIVIERRMHRSAAFRKLSANSIFVLFEFLSRRKMVQDGRKGRWSIANNGEIIFTYAEAQKRFGMFRSTFCRSIDQLVDLGFIEISHHGGGLLKDYSKYATQRLELFPEDGPASSTVFISGLVSPKFLIEMEAIAVLE